MYEVTGINVLEKLCSVPFVLYLLLVPKSCNYIDQRIGYIIPCCKLSLENATGRHPLHTFRSLTLVPHLLCLLFCTFRSSLFGPCLPFLEEYSIPLVLSVPGFPFRTIRSVLSVPYFLFHTFRSVLFVPYFSFRTFRSVLSVPYFLFRAFRSVPSILYDVICIGHPFHILANHYHRLIQLPPILWAHLPQIV